MHTRAFPYLLLVMPMSLNSLSIIVSRVCTFLFSVKFSLHRLASMINTMSADDGTWLPLKRKNSPSVISELFVTWHLLMHTNTRCSTDYPGKKTYLLTWHSLSASGPVDFLWSTSRCKRSPTCTSRFCWCSSGTSCNKGWDLSVIRPKHIKYYTIILNKKNLHGKKIVLKFHIFN